MGRHIAEIALQYMTEEGHETIVWGDGALVNIGVRAGLSARHPLDMMQRVANALGRAKKHFEVFHINGCDSRARRRITRGFRPLPTPSLALPASAIEGGTEP